MAGPKAAKPLVAPAAKAEVPAAVAPVATQPEAPKADPAKIEAIAKADPAPAADVAKTEKAVQPVKADVFEELARLGAAGEKFDIVLMDPPPFVKSKRDLETGAKAYRKLGRLAADVTAEGGFVLIASCSHNIAPERFAAECAAGLSRTSRRAALIRQSGAGPDHPVHPMLPESAYLKALVYALD